MCYSIESELVTTRSCEAVTTTKQDANWIRTFVSQPGDSGDTGSSQWRPSQPGDEDMRSAQHCLVSRCRGGGHVTDGIPHSVIITSALLRVSRQPLLSPHTQPLSSQANPLFTLIIPKQSYSTHPDLPS